MNGNLIKRREWIDVPVGTQAVPAANNYDQPQSGSILDYWQILCRRKLLLAALALTGLAIGAGVSVLQPRMYQARTTLEVQDLNQEFMNMKFVSPVADSSSINALTDMQTQIQILQSNTLLDRALEKLAVSSPKALAPENAGVEAWRKLVGQPEPIISRDELITNTAKNLKVNVSGQTRILEIRFDSSDPNVAAGFANVLANEFIDQNMQARWEMSRHTSEWLVKQLDDLRSTLQHSEDALQAYARSKGLIYTSDDKEMVSGEKLRLLQTELLRAQADRVARQSRFEITRSSRADTLPDVLNDSNLRALQTNLTDLRRKEAELGATFKPDYSKVKKIHAEIASLESALEQERTAIVSRINNEFEEAQTREKLLAAAYANQARLVTEDSQKSIQYNILKREVDTNRQVYENMLQRVKESSIASAMKSSNVRIIDRAKAPSQPYKPNLPLNSTIGLLSGLMLGIALVVARTRADSSLHEPGDAGILLGVPELGAIPSAAQIGKAAPSAIGLFPKDRDLANTGLVVSSSTPSLVADSFRTVLASIIFSEGAERRKVLVITSAAPHEGKTMTATNLAVALANINRRVLLIDGDTRSPRVHKVFNLDNSVGLTNLLNRSAIDDPSIDNPIHKTDVPNLYVLTSGPEVHTGADLLFSASIQRLIAQYRKQFDMVLIDTPPILSMPDARLFGRLSDAVVLVARAGRTSRASISAAFQRLVQDYTPVLGIILNDWKAKSSLYHGYYDTYRAPASDRDSKSLTTVG